MQCYCISYYYYSNIVKMLYTYNILINKTYQEASMYLEAFSKVTDIKL